MAQKTVSIPFKRESLSKGRKSGAATQSVEFQFPSNGKAYPKEGMDLVFGRMPAYSFNSLQTGKPIQRLLMIYPTDQSPVSIPFKRESLSKA